MRVTVSLSDRERHDWRDRATCRTMDPRDFDDIGTPSAWEACKELCDVVAECSADCDQEQPHGVYRAGRYWPEIGSNEKKHGNSSERTKRWLEWAHLAELGRTPVEIAHESGFNRSTVVHALRKMGIDCSNTVTPRINLKTRIDQWNDYARQGVTVGRAAALMGIEKHTLISYRRDARRLGMTVLEPVRKAS